MPNLTGMEVGKYRITKLIGRGGMADVYLGIHTHLEKQVAIKVLHSNLLDEGGDFVERFKREARAVANLHHPHIVQVHDFDIHDDLILMVMDYIDGKNLQVVLGELAQKGERLPVRQIGSIIHDIAQALDYAHSHGVLHRDIKPSNILIDSDGKAFLADFGIARIVGDQKLTATGALIGTPAYMSPEQGRGDELTKESDIYSLGIIAFEMLAGQVPYDAHTPIAVVHKQIYDPIPSIGNFLKEVPESTQQVIEKALAKTPAERYSSADDLVNALQTALQSLSSSELIPLKQDQIQPAAQNADYYARTVQMDDEADGRVDEPEGRIDEEQAPEPEKVSAKVEKPDQGRKPHPPAGGGSKKTTRKPGKVILLAASSIALIAIAVVLVVVLPPILKAQPSPTEPAVAATESLVDAPDATNTRAPTTKAETGIIGVVFDAAHREGGLALQSGVDFDVEEILINGETAWQTGNNQVLPAADGNTTPDSYMDFKITSRELYYIPLGRVVRIEIDYYDSGTDVFSLDYDGRSGGPFGDGRYKPADTIQKTDTGEFKTAVYELTDALFIHKSGGHDFRIADYGDGAEIIRSVRVFLLPK